MLGLRGGFHFHFALFGTESLQFTLPRYPSDKWQMLAYCTLIPSECSVEGKAKFVMDFAALGFVLLACWRSRFQVSISGFEGTKIAAGFWSVFLEIGFR